MNHCHYQCAMNFRASTGSFDLIRLEDRMLSNKKEREGVLLLGFINHEGILLDYIY